MIILIIYTSRCDWEWKDLGRFICLKIWPRLPNLSEKAIYPVSKKSDKSSIKDIILESGSIGYIVPYYNSSNGLPKESDPQLGMYTSNQDLSTPTSRESEKPILS